MNHTNTYLHKQLGFMLVFQNFQLQSIKALNHPEMDKINWEALRHDIPFLESEIDLNEYHLTDY